MVRSLRSLIGAPFGMRAMSDRPSGPSTALCPWFARCARSLGSTAHRAGPSRTSDAFPLRTPGAGMGASPMEGVPTVRTLLPQTVAREAGGPGTGARTMSLLDTLIGIFTDQDQQEAFQENPEGYLNQNGFGNVTSQDIQAEMPRVLESIQGNEGGATQGGAANFAGSGNVVLPPPPAHGGEGADYDGGGLSGAIESINHYTNVLNITEQSFEDNDVTTIDDRDTTVHSSVNQNITAFGDVNQDFDNDVVSGDGAVAAGDDSQVNTGAGAVQAGDDIEDSTIATGDVGGSVTGDNYDSIVGDDNNVIDDSSVGGGAVGGG